jgi:glutamyl-tRNA synthetase
LDKHRREDHEKGKTFIYNWHNRQKFDNSLSLSNDEITEKNWKQMIPYVIRFKSPEGEICSSTG